MSLNQTAQFIVLVESSEIVKHVLLTVVRTIYFIGLELAQYTNPIMITTMAKHHHWLRIHVVGD